MRFRAAADVRVSAHRAIAALVGTLLATAAAAATHAPGRAAACATGVIADLPGAAQWQGACLGGRADGLGVLRVGAAAPFGFFAGRMAGGRPGAGVAILPNGLFEPAAGFDPRGHPISTDSLHPEQQDAVFKLAARAARATADRFARAGNRGSADFYRTLAARIQSGEPE